jgi:hypothetical protein
MTDDLEAKVGESGLEQIIAEVSHHNSKGSWSVKKKLLLYAPFIFYAGMLKRTHQKRYAERIGWKEKNLTLANAFLFGLGMSALKYSGAETVGIMENSEFFSNISDRSISYMANLLGTTSKNFLYGYSMFDAVQSIFRIGYSQMTDKAIASFCIPGLFANLGQSSVSYFVRKRKAK